MRRSRRTSSPPTRVRGRDRRRLPRDDVHLLLKEPPDALDDYRDEEPLDARITSAAVPLLVILGEEDQVIDTPEAEEEWSDVPGVQIEVLDGVGHTPQIEAPEEAAELIVEFAADAVPVVDARGGKDGGRRSPRGAQKGNEGKQDGGRRRATPISARTWAEIGRLLARRSSGVAAARLRPGEQVVDGAEAVGDAVLAAVADQQHVDVAERLAAVGAALDLLVESRPARRARRPPSGRPGSPTGRRARGGRRRRGARPPARRRGTRRRARPPSPHHVHRSAYRPSMADADA